LAANASNARTEERFMGLMSWCGVLRKFSTPSKRGMEPPVRSKTGYVILSLLLLGLQGPASAQPRRPVAAHHYVIRFHSYPGAETRRELASRGMRILGYVRDNALVVSAGRGLELTGLDVSSAGAPEAPAKISPLVEQSTSGAYLVIFYPDVEAGRAAEVLQQSGFTSIPNPDLLPENLLAAGPFERVAELAAADEVSYILPASADLLAGNPVIGCAGPVTEAGPVAPYVLVGTGWPHDASHAVALHYFFQSYTDKLDQNTIQNEMVRAFAEWQKYANLTISPGDRADAVRTIAIRFARGDHGDSYPFDGPGGTLAHTFYPAPPNSEPIAGDMHLDADEAWHVGQKVDLFSVALHETGHALGLGHSDHPGAVMYPYYRFSSGLTDDDIAGVRSLYGSRDADPPANPPTAPPPSQPVTPPATPPPTPPATPPATPPGTPSKPSTDTTAPSLQIKSPGGTIVSTSSSTIHITGTASDDVGVTAVKFTTSNGEAGAASGTASWSADVPLLVGTNNVTIRAYDAAGNSAWRSLTVVRR
jgi:Matrixin/Glucodextranase, domain B